ncbi:MAG TPA: glycosyltransferase [Kiritimatiellia bacterium]|nr:glycosyltransferase [Kiritimatiellia bacterium]HMO99194.1 glycosyltransferase [Kiritimatiellia bacterium]HMP95781.1 glycosyltransferase [Kiritimatiellia bacterium]
MKTAIHQLVAGYSNGDAISNEARAWRAVFRSWGYASEIYCETKRILPELRKDTRDLAALRADVRPEDIAILHLSIGSEANRIFPALNSRKVIIYHNITPPEFFRGYQEEIAQNLRRGRAEMAALAGVARINLADSRFNADELAAAGYENPRVLPLLLDRTNWKGPVDRRVVDQYRDGYLNLLFVGRCAPNKRIEDLLFALYYCQRYVQRNTRLIHVGSAAGLERYQALLRTKAKELKVENFIMAGSVRGDELRGYYQAADAFLCLSEHEGFCIPLLEAMGHDVPVLAFDAGAVAETMGGAGVLFKAKHFDVIAETIQRVTAQKALRDGIVLGQRERLAQYEQQNIPEQMKAALAPLLA